MDATCACCASVPSITIPLYIYAPPLQNWIPSVPSNFHPQIYDTRQIIIPIMSGGLSISGNIPAPMGPSINVNMNIAAPSAIPPPAPMPVPVPVAQPLMPNISADITTSNVVNPMINVEFSGGHHGGLAMNVGESTGEVHMSANMGFGVNADITGPNVTGELTEVNVESQVFLPGAGIQPGNPNP